MAKQPAKTKARGVTKRDVHLGTRLRLARLTAKISQAELGDQLGVSFQQVQKYEKGTNRVSAIRLEQLAGILNVPSSYFFEGMAGSRTAPKDGEPSVIQQLLTDRDVLKLAEIMLGIPDKAKRSALLQLARTIVAT
jgi:transcriptional regulator with XRE-family HTH domain